jgi:hypothetical protein
LCGGLCTKARADQLRALFERFFDRADQLRRLCNSSLQDRSGDTRTEPA